MKKCAKCEVDISERGGKFKYCKECSELSKRNLIKNI